MKVFTSARVATAFRSACLAELEALKPGNVHIFADGHGMVVQDFVRSAEVAAEAISVDGLSVGQRILAAVEATHAAVGCNTNLGILLLAAPLVQAVLHGEAPSLRENLSLVLRQLTREDADLTFRAILKASPAGLGEAAAHDVHQPATGSLLEAMRTAEHQDLIAWQYTHDFENVFESGLPRYRELLTRWERPAWAATGVYLGFMSQACDTHIMRKQGDSVAVSVQNEARAHACHFLDMENPKNYMPKLLEFDTALKAAGLNPGTSADLTVATLMVAALDAMINEK